VSYASSDDAERHAALENMSRIKSLTPADVVYKDGTPFTGTTPNGVSISTVRGCGGLRGMRSRMGAVIVPRLRWTRRQPKGSSPDFQKQRAFFESFSRRDHDGTRASARGRKGRSDAGTP
jgi:hypothetical protein